MINEGNLGEAQAQGYHLAQQQQSQSLNDALSKTQSADTGASSWYTNPAISIGSTLLTNRASAKQAEKQMAFQERMSSTAHQRQVVDLKAAGLNPILSANTGVSSPGGAMAQMKDPAPTALSAHRLNQEIHNMRNVYRLTTQQRDTAKATERLIQHQGTSAKSEAEFWDEAGSEGKWLKFILNTLGRK